MFPLDIPRSSPNHVDMRLQACGQYATRGRTDDARGRACVRSCAYIWAGAYEAGARAFGAGARLCAGARARQGPRARANVGVCVHGWVRRWIAG